MFQIHLGKTPNGLTPENFKQLGDMTEGYSGSDIRCSEMQCLRSLSLVCVPSFSRVPPFLFSPLFFMFVPLFDVS